MNISPNVLLVLSALGFGLLWGVGFSNGMLDALNKVQADGFYPDDRPLRSIYSGYKSIDSFMTTIVAFFDALTNGATPGPRLLGIDLIAVVHCANVWAFVDTRRRGVQMELLRHAVPWIAAWNFGGVAVVLPLFCYYMSLSGAIRRDHTIPLNEARALLSLTVVGFFFPLLLFGPAILGWGTYHEHGYIAHYMWAAPLGYASVLVIASRPGATSTKDSNNPDADSELITMSYMLAGVYSAAVHVYTLWVSLTSSDPDLSLSRLFLPSPSRVGPSQSSIIVEGVHLFTQFDWHVVALTCMVFAYLQLEQGTKIQAPIASMLQIGADWETLLAVAFLVVTTIVLGPGAATSFGLAIREQGLRTAPKPTKSL